MNPRRDRTFVFGSEEHDQYRSINSSSESSCSSCCDYSDDSIPEWNSSLLENGELFFIKCSPIIRNSNSKDERSERSLINSSKSNKFSTFLKKRKTKKHVKGGSINKSEKDEKSSTTVKFQGKCSVIDVCENLSEHSVAVLFLNVGDIESSESGISDTLYHFPQSTDKNVVNLIKGALITLYHLLPKLVSEKPESSTIFIKEELVHVLYIGEGKGLMILACPENKSSLFELKQLGLSIRHCLNFKYRSLHDNPVNHTNLNQFFGKIFIKLLKISKNVLDIEKYENDIIGNEIQVQFEDTFIFPCLLVISHNLEMKIHEKLNEIEANDFGDLSEDHYGGQRLFTILGTCLYFKGNLIATHLSRDDLLDVHSFLRLNDILDLTVTSIIESLVIWQQVYPSSSYNSHDHSRFVESNRRCFLLVVGKDQGLLVTLLESGGCSVNNVGPSKPDELYVEQIQDALSDIILLGLSDAVEQCMKSSNTNSITFHESTSHKSISNLSNVSSVGSSMRKLNDLSSSSGFDHDAVSHHSSAQSLSRTTSSVFSDDVLPVLGRRAQRIQQLNNSGNVFTLSQSNLSDSDRSDYDTTGSSHSSSLIDSGKRFLKDPTCSKRVIHGDEKALFYYVNLHTSRGIILYSVHTQHPDIAKRCQSIIKNFNLAAQKIHTVLSQKKVPTVGKIQRNTMPVKEYGILFEYCGTDEDHKKSTRTSYWVVGRTFNRAQLGEVYVCYEDRTPQNLVEIAFRLAMTP